MTKRNNNKSGKENVTMLGVMQAIVTPNPLEEYLVKALKAESEMQKIWVGDIARAINELVNDVLAEEERRNDSKQSFLVSSKEFKDSIDENLTNLRRSLFRYAGNLLEGTNPEVIKQLLSLGRKE